MLKTFIIPIEHLKHTSYGYANGYVIIPNWYLSNICIDNIQVHWGITFRERAKTARTEFANFTEYLIDTPDDSLVVWFDTCHAWDDEKLDEAWCEREVAKLAETLEKIIDQEKIIHDLENILLIERKRLNEMCTVYED